MKPRAGLHRFAEPAWPRPREREPVGRRVPPLWVLGVVLLTIGLNTATAGPLQEGANLRAGPNLLLVTLDTLRADRLGSYGATNVETPVLDQLAAEGVRFEQVASAVPITLPSHSALLTGLYPFHNGVRDNGTFTLASGAVTLTEILSASGYRTGGFVSSFVLDARFSIGQGFDTYTSFDSLERGADSNLLSDIHRPGTAVIDEAMEWIGASGPSATEPFFAWVHLYEPHTPYEPPEPYASRYLGRPYDGEVAYTDALVGDLLARLRASGHRDDTLVIVTSDHGEGLGDHDEEWHTFLIYDSTTRVPLILWQSGAIPAAVEVSG